MLHKVVKYYVLEESLFILYISCYEMSGGLGKLYGW